MKIACFLIDNTLKNLTIEFSADVAIEKIQLNFEYLRISSPANSTKKLKTSQVTAHKKDVLLTNIESVAKHGYRFIFNDGHSAIYSEDYVQTLVLEYKIRWQNYLNELKTSGHSRETMINFKQL